MKQSFQNALAFVVKNKWYFLLLTPALGFILWAVFGEANGVSNFGAALLALLGPIAFVVSWLLLVIFGKTWK